MGIVSGEAVHLDIRLARAGSRALALLVDILVQIALFMGLSTVVTIAVAAYPLADEALFGAAQIILVAFILIGYPALCHALLRGRSVGKLAMGLRVVRADGGPINFRQSLIRALVGAALEWPGVLLGISWLVSLSLLVGSARAQRLADMAAGTIVIHERTPEGWGWIPTTPPGLIPWAVTLDLTDVDDQLALAARHFLARSRSLREPHRGRLGEALAKEMLARTTPPPPPNTPGWAYLAAVVGERHRRAAARLTQARAAQAKLWPELFPTVTAPPPPVPAGPPVSATAWPMRPAAPS